MIAKKSSTLWIIALARQLAVQPIATSSEYIHIYFRWWTRVIPIVRGHLASTRSTQGNQIWLTKTWAETDNDDICIEIIEPVKMFSTYWKAQIVIYGWHLRNNQRVTDVERPQWGKYVPPIASHLEPIKFNSEQQRRQVWRRSSRERWIAHRST